MLPWLTWRRGSFTYFKASCRGWLDVGDPSPTWRHVAVAGLTSGILQLLEVMSTKSVSSSYKQIESWSQLKKNVLVKISYILIVDRTFSAYGRWLVPSTTASNRSSPLVSHRNICNISVKLLVMSKFNIKIIYLLNYFLIIHKYVCMFVHKFVFVYQLRQGHGKLSNTDKSLLAAFSEITQMGDRLHLPKSITVS